MSHLKPPSTNVFVSYTSTPEVCFSLANEYLKSEAIFFCFYFVHSVRCQIRLTSFKLCVPTIPQPSRMVLHASFALILNSAFEHFICRLWLILSRVVLGNEVLNGIYWFSFSTFQNISPITHEGHTAFVCRCLPVWQTGESLFVNQMKSIVSGQGWVLILIVLFLA